MYLTQELPRNELATKITSLRQSMMKGGLALDRKGYSLLLEASVYLEDPQVNYKKSYYLVIRQPAVLLFPVVLLFSLNCRNADRFASIPIFEKPRTG